MEELYQRKIQSLLVEGGSQLLQSFIAMSYGMKLYREVPQQTTFRC